MRLFDFKKNTINEIEYEESKENASFSRIHISSTDEIWEWTNDITKGKKNPQYEIFTGNIQQFQKNPSNPEQNELLLQTSMEKIAIFVSDSIVETALAKTLFVPETKIKIIAQEKNQGNYELKSFEILKKAPPQKQKTSTAATLIKWTLLLLAGGICLKKIWFKNNLWEKIKASVISKK